MKTYVIYEGTYQLIPLGGYTDKAQSTGTVVQCEPEDVERVAREIADSRRIDIQSIVVQEMRDTFMKFDR